MIIEAFKSHDEGFHWIDVIDPSVAEIIMLTEKYNLHETSIQDCLDPKHLPKYEQIKNITFIMLRALDDKATPEANSVRELTHKLAIFMSPAFFITVHRNDDSYLTQIRDKWIRNSNLLEVEDSKAMAILLEKIIASVLFTYNHALAICENKLEDFEDVLIQEKSTSYSIQDKFLLKGQAYVFKRILRLTLDIIPKIKLIADYNPPLLQDLRETGESLYFETENILEHINNLINLHLSLASQKTSDILRVLTLFSVFFMPLTFIVGIYGMNFDYMPELRMKWGYPAVIIGMLVVVFSLYLWFRKREWV